MRFEIFIMVKGHTMILWVMTVSSLPSWYSCFRRTHCLYLPHILKQETIQSPQQLKILTQ